MNASAIRTVGPDNRRRDCLAYVIAVRPDTTRLLTVADVIDSQLRSLPFATAGRFRAFSTEAVDER